ncbi:MAG: hypothetical protein ACI8W3_001173 [Myxococcota bacterium]|jgi:hypothetical protein
MVAPLVAVARIALASLFFLVAVGCEPGLPGSVVKGPVESAHLSLHEVDTDRADLKGAFLATGTTGRDGSMQGLIIPAGVLGPLLIESQSGIDISTRESPILSPLRTILRVEQRAAMQPVYATPLTTLVIELARLAADLSVGAYRGNGDGIVAEDEFLAALDVAEEMVAVTFGLGLLDDADLFTSPPIILGFARSEAAREAALGHRIAIEVLSTLLYEMLDDPEPSNTNELMERQLFALARDLVDGEIDATEFGEIIAESPTPAELTQLLTQDLTRLRIPNSRDRISDLNFRISLESVVTAPRLPVRPRRLAMPDVGDIVFIVDTDGDGFADPQDAFPMDPAEWVDSDDDGVGDNSDAYPENPACSASIDGNGVDCLVNILAGKDIDQMLIDSEGVVHLLIASDQKIVRWDSDTEHFLHPISLSDADRAVKIASSESHGRLYVAYESGVVSFVEAGSDDEEQRFVVIPPPANEMVSVGEFLMVQGKVGLQESQYIFDRDGVETDSVLSHRSSREYQWNPILDRVEFFRSTTVPNNLHWKGIHQTTGMFVDEDATLYSRDYPTRGPLVVSGDGMHLLLGSGGVYEADTLVWLENLPDSFAVAAWPTDSGPVTLAAAGEQTELTRRDDELQAIEHRTYPGQPLGVFELGDAFLLVLTTPSRWSFEFYVPNPDSDDDGIANEEDAFPLDPAASADRDDDGYPDAWNPGSGPADSTEGLQVDAFPEDVSCQLPEHGFVDAPELCDIGSAVPLYDPDQIVVDRHGVIYLLSSENDRVFRWSTEEGDHLDPIEVRDNPAYLAYSSTHDKLYLSYQTGAITQIDLGAPKLEDRKYAHTPGASWGIQAAGKFVFAVDHTTRPFTHYTFAPDGSRISRQDWTGYGSTISFSEANNRIYLGQDGYVSNHLVWSDIDPATGEIAGFEMTERDPEINFRSPIRISPDGSRIMAGSQAVYDGSTHDVIAWLGVRFTDGVWLENRSLVTIRDLGDRRSLVEQWDPYLARSNAQIFEGDPIRVLLAGDEIIVITSIEDSPAFATYVPSNDGDGDGVINEDDAFPLDPAAARDSDHDGYPDAWNSGMGGDDSIEALGIDAFPYDAACQLVEHGSGGSCDLVKPLPTLGTEEVCEFDRYLEPDLSGTTIIGATGDFVPLCDGWIISADADNDRVTVKNVIADRNGAFIQLQSTPGDLELDADNKRLYIGLHDQRSVAVLDLITWDLRVVKIETRVNELALGADGGLFVLGFDSHNPPIHWLALDSVTPMELGTIRFASLMEYNEVSDELITAGSSAYVTRHEFDSEVGLSELQTTAQRNVRSLDVSRDGEHVLVLARDERRSKLFVYDFNASDIDHILNRWDFGTNAESAVFDATATSVAVFYRDGGRLVVRDATGGYFSQTHDTAYCQFGSTGPLAYSRGNKILFGQQLCGSSRDTARIHWWVPE